MEEKDGDLFDEPATAAPRDEFIPLRVVLKQAWLVEIVKRGNLSRVERECLVAAGLMEPGTE